jgi:hypothetical protein
VYNKYKARLHISPYTLLVLQTSTPTMIYQAPEKCGPYKAIQQVKTIDSVLFICLDARAMF